MRELSIFVDESGDKTHHARYFIITMVLHDQGIAIVPFMRKYEQSLKDAGLPDVPFHSEPLLNGHGNYENLSIAQRKKMLSAFSAFVRHLPIRYLALVYPQARYDDAEQLSARLRKDISDALANNLAALQSFDKVKIYYDNGQALVKQALQKTAESRLSKQAIVAKRTTMTDYRLAQVADYLCTIELAATKYQAKEESETYRKFFGGIGPFKKNWLKQARRHKTLA